MDKVDKFVKEIYTELIEKDIVVYKNMLDNKKNEPSISQYAKDIDTIYKRLSSEEKDAFLRIIKQTNIDTISALLRIIDGFGNINYDGIEPKLFLGGQDTDGDVQDLFLEYIEEIEEMDDK
jgi:hypothetical protein